MKKAVVMLSAVVCMAWAAGAQTSLEYSEMNEWLFSYMLNGVTTDNPEYNSIKQEWSNFGDKIYQDIKASLPPVDPSVTAAIKALQTNYQAEREQRAISLGYTSFDDLYNKTSKGTNIPNDAVQDFYVWYKNRGVEVYDGQNALMKTYNDELNSRFRAAFVEAVKKLQENSTSMQ
jgi:hypothetical protein